MSAIIEARLYIHNDTLELPCNIVSILVTELVNCPLTEYFLHQVLKSFSTPVYLFEILNSCGEFIAKADQ